MSNIILTKPTEEPKNGIFVGAIGKGKSASEVLTTRLTTSGKTNTLVLGTPESGKASEALTPCSTASEKTNTLVIGAKESGKVRHPLKMIIPKKDTFIENENGFIFGSTGFGIHFAQKKRIVDTAEKQRMVKDHLNNNNWRRRHGLPMSRKGCKDYETIKSLKGVKLFRIYIISKDMEEYKQLYDYLSKNGYDVEIKDSIENIESLRNAVVFCD